MSELKTCFKRVDDDLAGLLHYIEIGDNGLPDIQRPFVWANAKVRDLFDSMYRGFPVGYLLFWENIVAISLVFRGIRDRRCSSSLFMGYGYRSSPMIPRVPGSFGVFR